jgi:hypothetical protein
VNVADLSGLARIGRFVSRLTHDDKRLSDRIVTLDRDGALVGRIICSTLDLACYAYRIAVGVRFRREDSPALDDQPLLLAA